MEIKAALTDQIVAQAEVRNKQYKLSDGGGLFLLIRPDGAKYWRVGYRFAGKQNTLSLGVYPNVMLADARIRRDDARRLLAAGIDPSAAKRAEKSSQFANEARQIAATRFILDNEGALTFRLGNRYIPLTCAETKELRAFLDATRAVTPKEILCP